MSRPDAPAASETLVRVRELAASGGVSEVTRGIRDYLMLHTPVPVSALYRTAVLRVDGVRVQFETDSQEAVWRADGHGERPVMRDYLTDVDAGDHVWDVGANIGSYALLAAAAGADVTAFEPGPQARADLLANAGLNECRNRIDATPYALADWTGEGVLLPAERAGIRELARDADQGDTVPVARGEALDLPQPDVIKIDVEGAEVAVLDGLGAVLAGTRVCYVEIHEGVSRHAVVDRLSQAGLSVVDEWDEIVKAERVDR